MIVEKEKIIEAKNIFGEKAAEIISRDLMIENWDDKSLKGSCPMGHEDNTPSFIWNPKNDSFHCFSCGSNYGIIDHYIKFYNLTFLRAVEKLFEETNIKHSFGEIGIRKEKDYKYPKYTISEDRTSVERYCATRGLSKDVLDYCGINQSKEGLMMFDFYDENDVLLTVKCRNPFKTKDGPKEWYLSGYDNSPILYNMNKIDTTQTLLITEGMMDTLACIDSGYINSVSIPGGTENLKFIEKCYDWLEGFKNIILWFDNDEPGIKARKEVASRLGAWRVMFVDLPKELEKEDGSKQKVKDANEVLYYFGKQTVLNFINNAQEVPIAGIQDLSTVDDFDIEKAAGLIPGISVINNIVYKFLFGSVAMVTGQRGSGKSSLINQMFICEALNQGHDIFVFSGELSPSVLKSWIELTMAGKEKVTMKDKFNRSMSQETKNQMRDWYKSRVWIYDDTDNSSDTVLNKAVTTTRKYGTKIWIIDNLMTLDLKNGENNTLQKQKEFLAKLIQLSKLYNVLIVLVAHPRKLQSGVELSGDDVAGSGDMANLAQYIISVKRFGAKEKEGEKDNKGNYKNGKEPISEDVEVSILKNRYTGFTNSGKLYFDYPSYRFYGTNEELYKRYAWNKDTSPIPKEDISKKNIPDFMRD